MRPRRSTQPHDAGADPGRLELTAAAALFDMDGTLVDSTAVVEGLWARFGREHDLHVGELLAYSHGRRTPDIVRHVLTTAAPDEIAAVVAELERRELEADDGIVEVAGAGDLLRQLELHWAVVTSAPRELAARRMAVAGQPEPPVLVAAEDVARGKPAPDGYRQAAAILGVDAADCVALEDAEPGVRSALAAGALVVVVGGLDTDLTRDLDGVPDLRGIRLRPA
jgi:sugar-phosphatase